MKVIARDNMNRDYQPERLITVSISEELATKIADNLNLVSNGNEYFFIANDDYKISLDSMYDLVGEEPPIGFYVKQYGLEAFRHENGIIQFLDNM